MIGFIRPMMGPTVANGTHGCHHGAHVASGALQWGPQGRLNDVANLVNISDGQLVNISFSSIPPRRAPTHIASRPWIHVVSSSVQVCLHDIT